jgi:hypothetical protein
VTTNVSTRRIFHTALDLTGQSAPLAEDDPNTSIEALSLARATNGRPDTESGIAFAEAYPPSTFISVLEHRNPKLIENLNLRQVRRGVYDGDHKLTMVHDRVEGLFDTQADPTEMRDIADQQPTVTQRLKTQINDFVQTETAQRPAVNGMSSVDEVVEDNLRALGYID